MNRNLCDVTSVVIIITNMETETCEKFRNPAEDTEAKTDRLFQMYLSNETTI